jgi:uncharacterized protein (TIGR04255 family)
MPIKEVFPNPTVKQVIFQIRFPNLFYLDTKIGEFQIEIMDVFPESSLAFKQPFVITDIGNAKKLEDLTEQLSQSNVQKMWRFSSPKNFRLNVLNDSLDITTEYHKTYDNKVSENRFRDVICLVVDKFFKVTKVPILNRIGLRYIDECPLPTKNTETYKTFYNTCLPLDRFPAEESEEMEFKTVTSRGPYFLRYIEMLKTLGDKHVVILDFDGFAKNIKSADCMPVTDELHTLVIEEYTRTIKEPVYEFMRQPKG